MPSETGEILKLSQINGRTIEQIENRMKKTGEDDATTIYLGQNESLLELLAEDNDTVIKLGITHHQVAETIGMLFKLTYAAVPEPSYQQRQLMSPGDYSELIRTNKRKLFNGIPIQLNDKHFLVSVSKYEYNRESATITSPFADGIICSSEDITVIDLDELSEHYNVRIHNLIEYNRAYTEGNIPTLQTAKRKYPFISRFLIEEYGFYEGKESNFRIDPKDVIQFLNIKPS